MNLPCIIIPAYKPDHKMVDLIQHLLQESFTRIIVIDDGSGAECDSLFAEAQALGCTVLRHGINMGKGRAMKTGLNHGLVSGLLTEGVIFADADGQHTPADIRKIADAMAADPEAMVLGVRQFSGSVPLKSRLGNGFTRFFFSLIHGSDVKDTQTGLRGLQAEQIPLLLSLNGERYEYEMNMLLAIRPNEIKLVQIPIETVYIEGNRSSHFKAFQDSVRIYKLLVKFVAASLFSTLVDYALFAVMHTFVPGQLLGSVAVARAVSSVVNYSINNKVVFKRKRNGKSTIYRYYALAIPLMFAGYGLIKFFNIVLGIDIYLSKVITDVLLYVVSFIVQREFVYHRRPAKARKD